MILRGKIKPKMKDKKIGFFIFIFYFIANLLKNDQNIMITNKLPYYDAYKITQEHNYFPEINIYRIIHL